MPDRRTGQALPVDALLDLPGNLAPPGVEIRRVRTRDGLGLRAACWRPAGLERGTILLLQGRAEFIEKYHEVVGELLGRGFRVVAFDWRGQGGSDRLLSDGRRGHVRHFSDFRLDYEAVRSAFRLEAPPIVLAHSMGGCIALSGACAGWLEAERLVASSPMVSLSIVKRAGLVRWLARLLARLGFGGSLVPGGQGASISTLPFPGNRLGTDPARYARNAEVATALGAGAIGSPTVGWLLAAYEAMDALAAPGAAGRIRIPTLIIAAGDDPVCSTPAIELFGHAIAGGTLVTIPGARHEVMQESDAIRAAFWSAFDAFVAGTGAEPGAIRA